MANFIDHGVLRLSRRSVCAGLVAAAMAAPLAIRAQTPTMHRRPIPRSGELVPVIGLGTSDEFEYVPEEGDEALRGVIETLFAQGGTIIDTAPGYGDAELLLGRWLDDLGLKQRCFLCSKVSSFGRERGMASLERTQALLGKVPIDLLQVHSLRDTDIQLENLAELKARGYVRYIGITTYRGMDYDVVERYIRANQVDVIQTDYSVVQTLAEERLIPVAQDHGVAVMVNSAFGNGSYFAALRGQALPAWAEEFDCSSWAQFSLKYILGQAGVTCVLAATSDPRHMLDNATAGVGALPDTAMRTRMAQHMRELLG